jgi:peptidoglycan/LPS O-acetylase OafA/YrhL
MNADGASAPRTIPARLPIAARSATSNMGVERATPVAKSEGVNYFSRNNFDLIRLIAASQVMLVHAITWLDVTELSGLKSVLIFFPGVPAFFFVSGFLISAAWERNPDPKVFYLNRAYRIFPALWLGVIGSLIAVLFYLGSEGALSNSGVLAIWVLTQGSFFQAWNPEMLRDYGVGVANGVLWTIHIELSFYIMIPIYYWLKRSVRLDVLLVIMIVISFALNYSLVQSNPSNTQAEFLQKAIGVTLAPWIGMFGLGMLAQSHKERLYRYLAGRFVWAAAVFLTVALLTHYFHTFPVLSTGNSTGVLNYLTIVALVFSAGYSGRSLSDRILSRNDISYGIYIFHMPIVNVLLQHDMTGLKGFLTLLPTVILISAGSWFLLEKRVLARRRRTLYSR